jgi:AcrR family transcriptional regulator
MAVNGSGERRHRLDRESVLSAAEELVDEHGLDAVTMTMLAARLDAKVPSLYNHVQSLEELRGELQIRCMRDLAREVRRAAMGSVGSEGLQRLAATFLAFARAHPHRYAAMTRPIINYDAFVAASAEAVEALAMVIGSTGLTGDEGLTAQMAFFAALHGYVSLETSGFLVPLDEDHFDGNDTYEVVVRGAISAILDAAPAKPARAARAAR